MDSQSGWKVKVWVCLKSRKTSSNLVSQGPPCLPGSTLLETLIDRKGNSSLS